MLHALIVLSRPVRVTGLDGGHMANRSTLHVVARDIAEPIHAGGELGWTFKQVKWREVKWPERPPYEEESDYWILVAQDGAPKGIVHVDTFMGCETNDEPLAERMEPIDASTLIVPTTPFLEILRLFASRPHLRYYLLDGGQVTHWLEDWHLSRTPARLALLEPCLDLDAALDALMMLSPKDYLDDETRMKLRQQVGNWGYEVSDDRALIRCVGLGNKWELIAPHARIVAEAFDFMIAEGIDETPKGVNDKLYEIAKFRDGLVHGHAVLPISPFATNRDPMPKERHRHAATELLGLVTLINQMIDSLQRFVRRRTPRWEGGDFDPFSPPPSV